jgi:hypothetical protein
MTAVEKIGRERRERVSQLAWRGRAGNKGQCHGPFGSPSSEHQVAVPYLSGRVTFENFQRNVPGKCRRTELQWIDQIA